MPEVKAKILVMDDEEIVADIAKQMLEYLGYEVVVVSNGEDAITEFRDACEKGNSYDLVIMDLNIPGGMGGLEAVKFIREIDAQAKVVVSTGYSGDPQEYGKSGFDGSIAKPFDMKGLQDAVSGVLKI